MKVEIPKIIWHGFHGGILSIDFHPFSNDVATGGAEDSQLQTEETDETGYVKIWNMEPTPTSLDNLSIKYGLKGHSNNVNCVKFSPNGRYLASSSDDKCILIWEVKDNQMSMANPGLKTTRWAKTIILTGHSSEVMDLRWSADSKYIVSGGMDKRVIVWDVKSRQYKGILEDHTKFVQGVAVDPKFKYILSEGNDRMVKIWKNSKTKNVDIAFYGLKQLKKLEFKQLKPTVEEQQDEEERPDISPDGQLFLLPAGQFQASPDTAPQHCAYIYRRKFLQKPSFYISTKGEPSVCARFCPTLFKK